MSQRPLRLVDRATVWALGTAVAIHLNCTQQLTVQDAQAGLQLACQTLATALQSEHPGSTPEAWLLATEACNVARTTKIMSVLFTEHSPLPERDPLDGGLETSPWP